jgi:hypothetical protein
LTLLVDLNAEPDMTGMGSYSVLMTLKEELKKEIELFINTVKNENETNDKLGHAVSYQLETD